MMGRVKARKTAEDKTYSWGDLATMIETASERGGMSKVNSQFELEATCAIYRTCVAERDQEETPDPWTYNPYKDRNVHSGDFLIVVNILRDCA